MPKCPVCKSEYSIGIQTCSNCGFTELGVSFLNPEDAADWAQHVVAPCKAIWDKTHSGTLQPTLSLELQLNSYFEYSDMVNRLAESPTDYMVRSKLIDFMHQIYVYQFNYPFTDRRWLLREVLFHMSSIDTFANATSENHVKFLALSNTILRAELHLASGDWVLAMAGYAQYLSNEVFERDLIEFKTEDDPFLVNDDNIYFVLNNCKLICKVAQLPALSDKFDLLCRKVSSLQYDFADHNVDNFHLCGLRFNIQSPGNSDSFNEHLRTKGNVSTKCTYEGCLGKSNQGDVYLSPLNGVWTGHECELKMHQDYCEIYAVSDDIYFADLLQHKHEIWAIGNQIVQLFSK